MAEIPDTFDVETKLLRYLAGFVGPKSARSAYDALASQFGLGWSTQTQRMPNQGEPHWPNRVRSAMTRLVKKGYAERMVRNEWMATQKGRDHIRLIDNLKINI